MDQDQALPVPPRADLDDERRAESEATFVRRAIAASRMVAWEWNLRTGEVRRSAGSAAIIPLWAPEPEPPGWTNVHPDDAPGLRAAVERAVSEGEPFSHCCRFRACGREGWMWMESSGRVALGPDGKPDRLVGVSMDVTARVEAAQSALREREEFLAVASHELRTPLTAIRLQIQLLEKMLAGPDGEVDLGMVRQAVAAASRKWRRMSDLMEEMVDLGRLANDRLAMAREEMDLAAATRAAVDLLGEESESRCAKIAFEAKGDARGRWDRPRIERVIANLLSNAIKYGEGRPVHVSVDGTGAGVALRVSDEGVGMPAEFLSRIFRPFSRAAAPAGPSGLGLGLYLTRQIVERHGGTIRAESEIGRGTTFTVELPRV